MGSTFGYVGVLVPGQTTNDSMSLLTMIMNPDRAKNVNDMMNKLDRWEAVIRGHEMKSEKDDISDKLR